MQQLFSSNCWPDRAGHTPRWLILHGTAGGTSAQAIANWFASTASQVSAHYVVGQDGAVIQCVPEAAAAWANGLLTAGHDPWWNPDLNPNLVTISIEHVKASADNSDGLTPAQQSASFVLIQEICARNSIPMHMADASGGITGHFSIDPVNRSRCPGPYPWDDLFAFLNQRGGEEVLEISQAAGFFTEVVKDQRWHCKQTNIDIAYAILDYYRTCTQVGLNGLSQYGLPLSNEERIAHTKQAVLQRFERGVIIYDPAYEVDRVPGLSGLCYPAHIDKEPGQDPRIAQLQTQLAATTKKGGAT